MQPLIRDVNFSIHQALAYLGTVRLSTTPLVILFVAVQLVAYDAFLILQFSDIPTLSFINVLRTLIQGGCTATLSYDLYRRLLLGRAAKPLRGAALRSSGFARYLLCVLVLSMMGDLGMDFCLLGDSNSGPGRMLSNLSWGASGMLWLLCALYFPRLAIGVRDVSMWQSIREMRAATLPTAARLAGSALLVTLGTFVGSIAVLTLAEGFRLGEQIATVGWIVVWAVGDLAAVCAFTSMACLLFSLQQRAEAFGVPPFDSGVGGEEWRR